jgi:hypothetical protein
MKSIIFFETNEIPWRVVDDYVKKYPNSILAQLLDRSETFETICEDEIELDPWISWPTLHRGVKDKDHGILHLGQSLDFADKHYPPLWSLLRRAGTKVGVFGSLHSAAIPPDARNYAFYMPDYFATEPYANPCSLLGFQKFNLAMTRRSARNVDPSIPLKQTISFGSSVLRHGLSPQTIALALEQLITERLNPARKIRRRAMQSVIGLDFFIDLLRKTKPDFATFYTNHVAAVMHRYWAAHFTADWGDENPMGDDWIEKYQGELTHAMQILDLMLSRLKRFVEREDGYGLIVMSSLGQAKIETGRTKGFTTVTDVAKFMDFLGLARSDWRERPAMVPCVSLDINPDRITEVAERLTHLEVQGVKARHDEREIPPLSFNIRDENSLHLYFYFEGEEPHGDIRLGNRVVPIEEAGFGFFAHEDNVACSAHHIAEGFMAIYDPSRRPAAVNRRGRLSTLDIAPAILNHFGVAPPPYMRQRPALAL